MNFKILLGAVLSIVFYFWQLVLSLIIGPIGPFNFWIDIIINLSAMIVIFSIVSLIRTIAFKKQFEGWEIYQITGSFLVVLLLLQIGFSIWNMMFLTIEIGPIDMVGVLLYTLVISLAVYGGELLVASYFFNIFQIISGVKGKLDIPLSQQIKVTLGLILAVVVIGFVYEGMFNYTVDNYGTTILFLLIGGLPLVISVYLLRKPPVGIKLKEEDSPKFFKDVKEISDKVGVSIPHGILISPTTEIAVTGLAKKRLVLGIATLNKLNKGELKSIIAHEMGHFYGGDTVVGYLIANLRLSFELVRAFVPSAVLSFLFAIISYVFTLITLAYSRQVEYRADIVASRIFGGKGFSSALVNYAAYANYFEEISWPSVHKLAGQNKMFKNIYDEAEKSYGKKENQMKKHIVSQKTSFLSTHPTIGDRIKKVEKMGANKTTNGKEPASEYFKDFSKMQEDATKLLTAYYVSRAAQTK